MYVGGRGVENSPHFITFEIQEQRAFYLGCTYSFPQPTEGPISPCYRLIPNVCPGFLSASLLCPSAQESGVRLGA